MLVVPCRWIGDEIDISQIGIAKLLNQKWGKESEDEKVNFMKFRWKLDADLCFYVISWAHKEEGKWKMKIRLEQLVINLFWGCVFWTMSASIWWRDSHVTIKKFLFSIFYCVFFYTHFFFSTLIFVLVMNEFLYLVCSMQPPWLLATRILRYAKSCSESLQLSLTRFLWKLTENQSGRYSRSLNSAPSPHHSEGFTC